MHRQVTTIPVVYEQPDEEQGEERNRNKKENAVWLLGCLVWFGSLVWTLKIGLEVENWFGNLVLVVYILFEPRVEKFGLDVWFGRKDRSLVWKIGLEVLMVG